MSKSNTPKKRRIVQIAACDADFSENINHYETVRYTRQTLFVLCDDGSIWTRAYRDGAYREWFPLAHSIETA